MPIHDWSGVDGRIFHDFHQSWTVCIKEALNARLFPAKLLALVEKRTQNNWTNRIVIKHNLAQTIAAVELVSPIDKDTENAFVEFVDRCLEFIRTGVHLLIVDLFPPTKRDPLGVHQAIWEEFEEEDVEFAFPPGKDRILASYNAGRSHEAYVEPIAVGDLLREMPLFLGDRYHVKVPLESTYEQTWAALPDEWKEYVKTGVLPSELEPRE